jgi:hypothetical protein
MNCQSTNYLHDCILSFFLWVSLFLLAGCQNISTPGYTSTYKPSEETRISLERERKAEEVAEAFSEKIARELKLSRGDRDFTAIEEKNISVIKSFVFFFHKQGSYDVERARELYFKIGQAFVDRVNVDKTVLEILASQPCTLDTLQLLVHFRPNKKENVKMPVEVVVNREGRVIYKTYDESKREYIEIFSETYEEALQKL